MAAVVIDDNEISLNGVYYPLARPVQSVLASIYPGKVVIGDTSKDSQLHSSVVSWSDWRGGIGIERMTGAADVNRAWYSTLQLRYNNHLVLPGLATETDSPDHSLSLPTIGAINQLGNDIYAVWNGTTSVAPKLYKYAEASDTWSQEAHAGTDQVTDSLVFTDTGGITYLVFAHYDENGSGYTYKSSYTTTLNGAISSTGATSVPVADASGLLANQRIMVGSEIMAISSISSNTLTVTRGQQSTTAATHSDGATVSSWWASDTTKGCQFVTVWDNRLWGISNAGQLWYAYTIGTELDDCKLQEPDGSVTAMFVARNANGVPIIYVSTLNGLFAHDAENSRFIETQMTFPTHPNNGSGTTKWRDSVYVPSGLGIYKYINGNNSAVITPIGPDRDDGVPSSYRGTIKMLAGTHNELLAGIDATTAPVAIGATDIPQAYWSGGHQGSEVIEPTTGFSSLIGYNEIGWETKWAGTTSGRAIDTLHVSNLYSGSSTTIDYRVWWGYNNVIYNLSLHRDIVNPSQLPDFAYAESGVHETPWFDAFQTELDKLAIQLKLEVEDVGTDETVQIQYATNYVESFENLATVSSSSLGATYGIAAYSLPSSDNPIGIEFQSIKFKLTFRREAGVANKKKSPNVVSMVLVYRKKLDAKWGHQVALNLSQEYRGKNPKELRSALVTAIEKTTLSEFTFRDDTGGTRNYYVDVRSATGLENTGYDERGSTTIMLVEP